MHAHSDMNTPTTPFVEKKQQKNTYLDWLDEGDQSKGPEAAEKGEEGKTEVVFSRKAGLGLQSNKRKHFYTN